MGDQKRDADRMLLNRPYMLGFGHAVKVDSDDYRRYIIISSMLRELLDMIGISIRCKAYVYIQDCIFAIIDQNKINIRLNTDVYPYVAAKYGVHDPAVIEHSIRNAIQSAYKLQESCGADGGSMPSVFGKRPTNKELLLHLAQEVYIRLCRGSLEASETYARNQ